LLSRWAALLIHLSLPSWACSGLPDKLTGRPALRQEQPAARHGPLPQSIRTTPFSLSTQLRGAFEAEVECKRLQIWLATVFSPALFVTQVSLPAPGRC
jgi:hypothetical protein